MSKFITHLAAVMMTMPVWASAQSSLSATIMVGNLEHTLVKTDNDCSVYLPTSLVKIDQNTENIAHKWKRHWRGACVNGLAEGRGVMASLKGTGRSTVEMQATGFYRAGLPMGYVRTRTAVKYDTQSEYTKDSETYSLAYFYGPQSILLQGFGVIVPDEAFTSSVVPEPQFKKFKAKIELVGNGKQNVNERLWGVTQSVQIDIIRCSWSVGKEQFAECADKNADVVNVAVGPTYEGADAEAYKTWRNALKFHRCPVSSSAEGCEELAYQKAESVRQEIIEFVRLTKPMVEAEMAKAQKLIAGK